jgi:DNA modification methylase/ParB-like chromosome segregation protein Spo0J
MMNLQIVVLPVDQIKIGARQRTNDPATEKHIKELASEIASNGLLHAVAVSKDHSLVAGYCRLSAVRSLTAEYYYNSGRIDPHFIPCVVVHQESEREQFRLELMENLRRKNLSPLDEARAVAALHRMFSEQYGPEWTQEDTGKELDQLRGEERHPRVGHAEVGDAILLEGFSNDPEVAKATSKKEAVGIARKKLEQAFRQGLGALAVSHTTDMTLFEADLNTQLPLIATGSVNGIITDPPYGVDADKFGDQAMVSGHQYADTPKAAMAIAEVIFKEGRRICQDQAHLYMFCDVRLFDWLKTIAVANGWQPFATPLIWHKLNVGHAPWPGYFSRRYECILFAQKGTRQLAKSRSDVFEYSVAGDKLHAAQKPIALYEELMSLSFFPGELVLDPCAGSGTIFRAAKAAGLRAIGCENDPGSANLCRAAIAEL